MELARGDGRAARELLAEAIVIADALGMVVVGERARALVVAAPGNVNGGIEEWAGVAADRVAAGAYRD